MTSQMETSTPGSMRYRCSKGAVENYLPATCLRYTGGMQISHFDMGPSSRSFIMYIQTFKILRKNMNSRMLWFQAFWVEEVHLCDTGGSSVSPQRTAGVCQSLPLAAGISTSFLSLNPSGWWLNGCHPALLKQTPHWE